MKNKIYEELKKIKSHCLTVRCDQCEYNDPSYPQFESCLWKKAVGKIPQNFFIEDLLEENE